MGLLLSFLPHFHPSPPPSLVSLFFFSDSHTVILSYVATHRAVQEPKKVNRHLRRRYLPTNLFRDYTAKTTAKSSQAPIKMNKQTNKTPSSTSYSV